MAENEAETKLEEDVEPEESTEVVEKPKVGEEIKPEDEVKPEDSAVVVRIGEETPPPEEEPAPEWVRELRKTHREAQKRIRELEGQLKTKVPDAKKVTLGVKPTLEASDYDTDRFEKDLEAWYSRKREIEAEEARERAKAESEQVAWNSKLERHEKAKADLRQKMPEFDDYEAVASENLSPTQQAILVSGADNSAVVLAALGSSPKKAKELASITDPVEFAFAVAKLETQLKVTPRKAPPPPETVPKGSGHGSGKVDATLARIEAEAEKTGDRTKIFQYRQQLRAAK